MGSASMNTVIENNRKLLPKRDKFKNRLGGYNSNKKTEYNLPKATSKQLRDIKKRMLQERKIWWIKVIVLTVILFLGLLLAVFTNFENVSYYLQY
ncbi:MAG: hypothetical protein HKP48_07490 [Winogradskyella sp.]|uniref:hypothetical protein n=1 Tax=Winogradskyella sp. TaxID=1883156 RepID=UPI00181CB39D|nr:hypothetical protein [Winogradskyella sp.]MBT8244637.1 hypothetical protein [Winogradskyella sp.]NNK23125.1 hypothetical protein [Winogradskyella sp.]